jgi:hypothetical protein
MDVNAIAREMLKLGELYRWAGADCYMAMKSATTNRGFNVLHRR